MNDAAASGNLPEYSVSELSGALKRAVEDSFGFVRVRGEISGLARPRSGHVYLSLKDERAVLAAVMWKGVAGRMRFRPEDGLEVVASGRLTTYPGHSKYQLVIETLEPAGVGALMALLEERRKKLAAEGLFAAERKRPIPFLPEVIGVVTSPSGAVIRDILHRLGDRFPRRVVIWPTRVQGEGAAEEIAAAIRGFDALDERDAAPKPDLIIVARGGGSIEDLWAFNEEVVARAVADCRVPLISAVGHETDTTLIDFVGDARAPTPTAAAEMAVPVRAELMAQTLDLARRMIRAEARGREARRAALNAAARGLPRPAEITAFAAQRLDGVAERAPRALRARIALGAARLAAAGGGLRLGALIRARAEAERRLEVAGARFERASVHGRARARDRLAGLAALLASLSYKGVLARGYALVRAGDGAALRRAALIGAGADLTLEFADGRIAARAAGGAPQAPSKGPRPKVKPQPKTPLQGDLF